MSSQVSCRIKGFITRYASFSFLFISDCRIIFVTKICLNSIVIQVFFDLMDWLFMNFLNMSLQIILSVVSNITWRTLKLFPKKFSNLYITLAFLYQKFKMGTFCWTGRDTWLIAIFISYVSFFSVHSCSHADLVAMIIFKMVNEFKWYENQ